MRDKRWLPIALCCGAACLAAAVYVNALGNPFVWDDHRTVVDNLSIRAPIDWRAVFYHDRFRPLVNASYAWDYALGGLSVVGYHVTSLLLHLLNVVLLFAVTWRTVAPSEPPEAPPDGKRRLRSAATSATVGLAGQGLAAFAAAGLFAVHPMLSQAVGYISGRAEVLCAVFFLAALLAAQSWLAAGRSWRLVVVAVAWMLALASKEVAVALPFVLVAYAVLVPGVGAAARRRLAVAVGVMLAAVAVAAVYRLQTLVQVENAARSQFAWPHLFLGLHMLREYTRLMLVPAGQSIFHSANLAAATAPVAVLLDAVGLLAVAALAWRARRWEPGVALGLAWFLLLLVPSSLLLVFDIGEPMAEQRVYLAAAGLALACGAGCARLDWSLRRRAPGFALLTPVALAACLVVLSVLTIERNRVWHDPVTLWSEAVEREPNVWVPYFALGDALRERGDYARAAEAYRQAVRLRPQEAQTYLPLATSLLMSGQAEEAEKYFERAERATPGRIEATVGRALAARMIGRRDEARDRLEAVARTHADAVLPRQMLAEIYERDYGDRASALRACLEVRALAPATPGVDDCVRRNQQPR